MTVVVIASVATVAAIFMTVTSAVVVVVFVLAVVMAVIMANFFAILTSVKVSFPAAMAAPVGVLTSNGERTVVAEARIVGAIDVAAKADRPMEPGSGSDEDSTGEPCWPVIAEGGASIGRVIEVAIGANGLDADVDGDLYFGFESGSRETEKHKKAKREKPERFHHISPKNGGSGEESSDGSGGHNPQFEIWVVESHLRRWGNHVTQMLS
jgi:hypothetical protein